MALMVVAKHNNLNQIWHKMTTLCTQLMDQVSAGIYLFLHAYGDVLQ